MHGEALAGVEGGRGEVDAAAGVALGGDGGGADQHVDFAGGEQLEAGRGGDGDVLHGVGIIEHRGGDRLAEFDIEAAE